MSLLYNICALINCGLFWWHLIEGRFGWALFSAVIGWICLITARRS